MPCQGRCALATSHLGNLVMQCFFFPEDLCFGSPLEGAATQPSPSPGRPGTQTGPRSKLSATLGRAGLPAGRLGVRTAGLQPDIFSPSSPLTHHRTRHEPTYVPIAVQKTTPRPLKHRRNKSDSFFLTNFRDIGRCPV